MNEHLDEDDPLYGMPHNPMKQDDTIHIHFHCHKFTMMEAVAACMTFIDTHNLETPDMNIDHTTMMNPINGNTLSWYEATVSAALPAGTTIQLQKAE